MLAEEFEALAGAGAETVVRAAGTREWPTVRAQVAAWFGRSDRHRHTVALERLDATATALGQTDPAGPAPEEEALQVWRLRFHDALEELEDAAQRIAVADLGALLSTRRVTETSGDPGASGA
ncbi:hypothetical protein [Phaeacidiphilus oryzae]|jgi:hypothetical protein|uniref:hypothetical protein n=1 Tax=Phaeacidiphilus oryzae TaxID=348818 RepID=UPI00126A3CD7|nr:hypothetical protein [Phaeacidiphilus oryzae]